MGGGDLDQQSRLSQGAVRTAGTFPGILPEVPAYPFVLSGLDGLPIFCTLNRKTNRITISFLLLWNYELASNAAQKLGDALIKSFAMTSVATLITTAPKVR